MGGVVVGVFLHDGAPWGPRERLESRPDGVGVGPNFDLYLVHGPTDGRGG